MEADPAPAQPDRSAPRLRQPRRGSSHPGVPAALLPGQPARRRTPGGHGGDVTGAGLSSLRFTMLPKNHGLFDTAASHNFRPEPRRPNAAKCPFKQSGYIKTAAKLAQVNHMLFTLFISDAQIKQMHFFRRHEDQSHFWR